MEKEMAYGTDYTYIPATSVNSGLGFNVGPDVYAYTIQIVNVVLIGTPQTRECVLVDAGMPGSADEITRIITERFGTDTRPKAILLTHGHFDHVGAIVELVEKWDVPVYAHEAEMPFLTGEASYPEPDPTVEGGLVAKMSGFFPNQPIDLKQHIQALPADGKVPFMPGFRWIHTPGHTPGHVSFFRDEDRLLIAGDAFVTVRQDSLYRVLTQEREISGPPRYFTTDWQAAWESVRTLEALKPAAAVTGHGMPMSGEALAANLQKLASEFDHIAIPDYGKYVNGRKQ